LRTHFTQVDGQPIQAFVRLLTTTRDRPAMPPTERAEGSAAGDRGGRAPLRPSRGRCYGHSAATGRGHVAVDDAPHRILWSMGILIRTGSALKPSPLEVLTASGLSIQYADFAVWQRQWLQGRPNSTSLLEAAAGRRSVLELPTDRPRPLQPTSTGRNQSLLLPKT